MASTGGTADAALLDESLEQAAALCEDLTPLVYARFFELRPDAQIYFQLNELDPRSHGRMLAEVLCLLQDSAKGEDYVRPTLQTIAKDHVSYGVTETAFYRDFLVALQAALETLLGKHWQPAWSAAWQRQCAALLAALR